MVGQVQVQDAELVHTTEELTEATHHIQTVEILGVEMILGATVIHTVSPPRHTQINVVQDQTVVGILGPGNKLTKALLRKFS